MAAIQLTMALAILVFQIITTAIADTFVTRLRVLSHTEDVHFYADAADIAGTGIWVGIIVSCPLIAQKVLDRSRGRLIEIG